MANRNAANKKGLVVQTLVIKPNTRSALDVGQWRTALKAADRGKREKLYDLYEDVMLDLVLSDAIDKRIDAITNAELTFTRNEQPVPEIEDLMDTPEWEEILREIMLSKFWGKTVIEFDFNEGLKPFSIPRKHIRPDKGEIVINPTDENGIPYRDDDFFLEVGKDNDLGLLLKLAPMAIYKRGGFGDWAQFIEIFGMPQRIGKYSSHDDESRKVLEQALENAGSAPWIVVPKETDIDTRESTSLSNALMHEKFKTSCNEEMLIGVLGQTMTTLNGSSRSQGEVHKEVEESKNKADRRFVQRVLNRLLLPMLEKRGFPVSGGYFYFAEAGETLTMSQQMELHDKFINQLGLEIDEDFLYETYSVPKPKGGAKPKPKKEEDKPKDDKDDGNEQKFWERVLSFFVLAPSAKGATQQKCPDCGGSHHTANLADIPEFNNDALIGRIFRGESSQFDTELFEYTYRTLIQGLSKGFAESNFMKPGIAYGFTPDALKTAMELNIYKFSATKTLAEVYEINRLFRNSSNFEEFYNEASKVTDIFNKDWLRTEYTTAALTADSCATHHRLASQTDIFPYWQYITVQDGKVRDEHAALHGLILPANDPRWAKIFPPNGWNCRCRIVPLTKADVEGYDIQANRLRADKYMKSAEWKKNAAQGFDTNRALTGEVFNKNQQYINKFPGLASKKLERMGTGDWGLDEMGKRIAKASNKMMEYGGTAGDYFAKHGDGDVIKFNDHKSREVLLNRKVFNTHTQGKYLERVKYLDEIKNILEKPNEVWFNNYRSDWKNLIFIRYYEGSALAVICELSGKVYQVNTWFKLATSSSEVRNMYRRGLLVLNK